jgi:hypothetical protein
MKSNRVRYLLDYMPYGILYLTLHQEVNYSIGHHLRTKVAIKI